MIIIFIFCDTTKFKQYSNYLTFTQVSGFLKYLDKLYFAFKLNLEWFYLVFFSLVIVRRMLFFVLRHEG